MSARPAGFGNVVGGKLKLKRPGAARTGGAAVLPAVDSSAAAAAAAVAVSAAPASLPTTSSGTKRKLPEPDDPHDYNLDKGVGASATAQSSSSAVSAPAAAAEAGGSDARHADAASGSAQGSDGDDTRTASQRAFDEAAEKRLKAGGAKALAAVSYREKIVTLNNYLERIPEHNDLFKIQFAGSG
jgi:hypothetical protein